MRVFIKALIIVSLLLSIRCSSNAKKRPKIVEKTPIDYAGENIKEAILAYDNSNYDIAIEKFNVALGYLNQALPASTPTDSIPQQIFKIRKNVANIHSEYAFTLSSQNDFDEALNEYETSISMYKSLQSEATPIDSIDNIIVNLYRNTAVCSRQAGDYQKAIDYYDLYLEANPDDDEILLQKFAIYRDNLKDEDQAFAVLKEYALSKNDFNACHRLGDLYKDKNDIINAIYWYEKALSVKLDSNVLQKLGTLYRNPSIKQWEKSIQVFEKFLTLKPNLEELKTVFKLIGDNYMNLKNKPKAVEYFEKYIELEYAENIALYICQYYFDLKNNSKAITWANLVLQNNPNNTNAIYFRALARYNTKDIAGAKADFERLRNDSKYGSIAQQYLKLMK